LFTRAVGIDFLVFLLSQLIALEMPLHEAVKCKDIQFFRLRDKSVHCPADSETCRKLR